jgi:hypothetical protein
MRNSLILIFLVTSAYVKAQDKVPELVTDRPDQTESSAVVPPGSLQIETGFIMGKDETSLVR